MDRSDKILCGVVGFLGFLTAVLAFIAEGTKVKQSQVKYESDTTCIFPTSDSPASTLGLIAALTLLLAQIIVSVAARCFCCYRGPYPSNSSWTLALISFIVSWVTFAIAILILLTASALNAQNGEESTETNYYYCHVVRPGVFSGAGILSIVTVALGIFYYLVPSPRKNEWANPAIPTQGDIAMAQPQFPQPAAQTTQDPVFVHEDTYMRRQYT
ncbi:DESIGUAL/Modifying wall lignin-1/2 [Dillenia turbinata]|uniref:DESIGUAL/Modifying wall lignin-1/2 n=1 Tax=Dillenia turbinata TaxID=194707 RepID=A0AAN8VB65_9MAGN